MHWMLFMLKITIYTSLLLTVFLHNAMATDNNAVLKTHPIDDKTSFAASMYTSLYSAIEMDSADEVKQFISFGADINHRYSGDITPIMFASSIGSINVVHALLDSGANSNLISAENMTAIDYAIKNDNQLIISALQKNITSVKADSEIILIRKIQFLLSRLGYKTGEVDGEFGKKTKQSLHAFSIDTKQPYPTEVSSRQVESLKNVFFEQDLIEEISSTNKKNITLDKDKKEELVTIETIPLEPSTEISTDSIAKSEDKTAPPENKNSNTIH